MSLLSFPKSVQKIFWSCNPQSLDKETHREYIIHQVLQYGDLSDYLWLRTFYTLPEIKDTFIQNPRATYQPQSYNFVKNFLLKIKEPLIKENYVRSAL